MRKKIKTAPWLQPIWWLAVLYVWFGTLYPFFFGTCEPGESIQPAGVWLSVVYGVLLIIGLFLFRDKPVFMRVFIACRVLQSIALIALASMEDIHPITVVSALAVVPYGGMVSYESVLPEILLSMFSLGMAIAAMYKCRKNEQS